MPNTHIDLQFADGTYRFALYLPQLEEIQDKCGAGIGVVYARVLQGRLDGDISIGHPSYAAFHALDLVEPVRQGLIGGAKGWVNDQEVEVGAMRANDLVERYLLPMPLAEQWKLAAAILFAKVEGWEDPAPDKKKARVRKKAATTAPDGSTTPAP